MDGRPPALRRRFSFNRAKCVRCSGFAVILCHANVYLTVNQISNFLLPKSNLSPADDCMENGIASKRFGLLRGAPARTLEPHCVHRPEEVSNYDEMIGRHAWLLNRPFVDRVSKLTLRKGRVLDIGCGPGWIPIQLALRQPEWEIWAVDASAEAIDGARRHAVDAGVSDRIHFECGNATALRFECASFDLAISHFLLHHIEDPVLLFNEMARVTRGGGRILIKDLLRQPPLKSALLSAFSKHILRYNPLQLQMYQESMAAALSFKEVHAALADSALSMARVESFRGLDFVISA